MNNAATQAPEAIPMTWHAKFRKTECGCPICGKPLTKSTRFIHVAEGGASIVRADLADDAVSGDMGWFEVGSTCAKKLGAAYSRELAPITG